MRTELHCHTSASDGQLSPTEVVHLARQRDVALLAITDHDTIAGNDEALAAGELLGVRVICGIEISALSRQGEVHVLGYGVRPSDTATISRIAALRAVREARARAILDKLARLGVHIPFEQVQALAGDAMIGRPHVARAMVKAGAVQTEQEAFDLYLAEGKPAFVPHEGLTPGQAVQLIHAAGGLAVLAHPGLYVGNLAALLDEMIGAGLDGIEVFYPLHTPDQEARFAELAHRHGLLLTGGSDFHSVRGDAEPSLGSVHVPPEHVEALLARLGE
ncbi:MAG: PHP domain-containing protein [Anaerolineae bacterium]|nr:PHP domain-containing protein [Anaerolineae bacterium]